MKRRSLLALLGIVGLVGLWLAVQALLTAHEQRQVGGQLQSTLPAQSHQVGQFAITWDGQQLTVSHVRRGAMALWSSLPGRSFLNAGQGRATVDENRGSFAVDDQRQNLCRRQSLERISARGEGLLLRGVLACERGEVDYTLTFEPVGPDQLAFEAAVADPAYNRLYLTYASSAEERFFGFGEQFSAFDLKGRRLPILVQEQGIGRGAQPVTTIVDLVAGAGGAWHTSYAPVPHYITSQLRSLFLENYEYAIFDLRRDDRVQIALFATEMRGRILNGDSPTKLIETYTSYTGRMRPLPDWINQGAVVGLQGGTARVEAIWAALQRHQVPISAFWLQDWVGQRTTSFGQQLWWNWELDRQRYPAWERLLADLGAADIRVMLYASPFLADVSDKPNHRRNLFAEAAAQGFLVRQEDGQPYLIQNTDFSAGLVDLSNPAARRWYKEVLAAEMLTAGASGWMADFGEALPFDVLLDSGATGQDYHNRYPEEWARLNRELVEDSASGDELLFFTRSGFTRSPGATTLFWLGDQLVSWDGHDGIKTAVTGLLSSGLSGFALNHSDIGGYTALSSPVLNYHRSKELLLRWMELNAFTAVFRSHEGNQPANSHQIYDDEASLAHFSRFARIYAALAPYRHELMVEAGERGLPLVRHPFIHYPDDERVYTIRYREFMLGPDFLIAPVLDEGVDRISVYLPEGDWVHLWSGQQYLAGPQGLDVEVAAPLGQPGVFYRADSPAARQFQADLQRAGLLQ